METERQLSAGGVIFREVEGRTEVALISVRGGKIWGLPKGHVEDGENIARTAHREVKEETGLDGKILDKIGHIEYFFSFKDEHETKRFFKIVYFFLMEYASGSIDDHDDEVDECRWVDIDKAARLMRYDDEKGIIRKAKKLIKAHRKEGSLGKKPEGDGGRL